MSNAFHTHAVEIAEAGFPDPVDAARIGPVSVTSRRDRSAGVLKWMKRCAVALAALSFEAALIFDSLRQMAGP